MTHDEQEVLHRAEAREHMYDPAHPERGVKWQDYKAEADPSEGIQGYQAINGHLYAGGDLTPDDHIRHGSFDSYQTVRDERLFRGLNARTQQDLERLANKPAHHMHETRGYVSTSYTWSIAEFFAQYDPDDVEILGEYIYEIHAPPGVPYAPIDPEPEGHVVGEWGDLLPNEDELVLPAGTSLYQTEPLHVDDNGFTVYLVIPIPPGYPPPREGQAPREYAMDAWEDWRMNRRLD